jgi:hypothetical protein
MNDMIVKAIISKNTFEANQYVEWVQSTESNKKNLHSAMGLTMAYLFLQKQEKALHAFQEAKTRFQHEDKYPYLAQKIQQYLPNH